MTVAELIDVLRRCDADAQVVAEGERDVALVTGASERDGGVIVVRVTRGALADAGLALLRPSATAQPEALDPNIAPIDVPVGDRFVTIAFKPETWTIEGRGTLRGARVERIDPYGTVKTDDLCEALKGELVPGLGVVAGVERFATMFYGEGMSLGILIAERTPGGAS